MYQKYSFLTVILNPHTIHTQILPCIKRLRGENSARFVNVIGTFSMLLDVFDDAMVSISVIMDLTSQNIQNKNNMMIGILNVFNKYLKQYF